MELTVVTVIVGIIATFAIPNYSRSIRRADERNIIANLMIMRAAVAIYTVDGTPLGDWNDLATINTNLGLSVLDPRPGYDCDSGAGVTNECNATYAIGAVWQIHFHDEHSGGGLHCTAGVCPTCPYQPLNCG